MSPILEWYATSWTPEPFILMHNFLPIKDTGKRFIITNEINKPFGSSFIISTSMETYMFNV